MIIDFGLHLDGMQPMPPRTGVGRAALGPQRFLDVLEGQLGLPPSQARLGEALLAYRRCLLELDAADRFYHRSLAANSLAVARTLLDWRSQWYEAGWAGRFDGRVSGRLRDVAAVEGLARERVPLCAGQRLQRIATALASGRSTQIERVVLHDEWAALPKTWQTVLEAFPTEQASGIELRPHAASGCDLHVLQQAMIDLADDSDGTAPTIRKLRGDGSVLFLRGVSRDVSAQAIAEHLVRHAPLDETVIIAERDGIILDNALERVGLPRAGFQHHTRFRAITQVLKLCMGLLWEPLETKLLLQFLIHPIGPLPADLRSALAEAVAREPGIGGVRWRKALEEVAERRRSRSEASGEEQAKLARDVAVWLECERYPVAEGAPLEALIERGSRCARWLSTALHARTVEAEKDLFGAALAQAEALIAGLEQLSAQGHTRIGKIELDQLVDEVSCQAPDPATFAEAGHVRSAGSPATITAPWRTIIWWDMAAPTERTSYPWSDAELTELHTHGVALAPMEMRISQRTRAWLRAIVNAREHLVLVVHDRDEGRHPLASAISSVLEGIPQVHVDDALLSGDGFPRLDALDVASERLAIKPLPPPRRWWALPPGRKLDPRSIESYSSLAKLIDHPHQWVLQYAARLRPGRAGDLARDALLNGNLAHRLFQSFFGEHPDWRRSTPESTAAWLRARLPALLEAEGAVLLEPGQGVTRDHVSRLLERALQRLLEHLREARIENVRAEHPVSAPFKEIEISGIIDLLLQDRQGREIVLDVKWGGEQRRGRELAADRYLQLATYAYLRRRGADCAVWPYPAFFIVSTANILAPDDRVFPQAVPHPSASGESVESVWRRMERMIEWRWSQLAAGRIETDVSGTEPTAESEPPVDGLQRCEEPDPFDEFVNLLGWEPGA